MSTLGCIPDSAAGEFPWESGEFPSAPGAFQVGLKVERGLGKRTAVRPGCISDLAGASESGTRWAAGTQTVRVRGGGNSGQGCAGSTAWGLRGRSVSRGALGSRPSGSWGNLLLDKWAGSGGHDRGPSLASTGASRRLFYCRDAFGAAPPLRGKKKNLQPTAAGQPELGGGCRRFRERRRGPAAGGGGGGGSGGGGGGGGQHGGAQGWAGPPPRLRAPPPLLGSRRPRPHPTWPAAAEGAG